jgi:predicted Zn-dependent peptidase
MFKDGWSGLLVHIFLFSFFASFCQAQNVQDFEKKLTQFKLENGITFLVYERHDVPVVSFFTYADVGSVNEVTGITGLAHIFEHMAFKGTNTIGTKDINKELPAMAKEDEAFERLKKEREKRELADPKKLEQLQKEFEQAKVEAQEWSNAAEFGDAIQRAGGQGLNAETQSDSTRYYYSLPSNKVELWFNLESERFLNPVLREFYEEKDVVMEERRLSTDSEPTGRLVEEFLTTAFKAHPYENPTIGFMSDLQNVSRAEAMAFFKKYYVASDLTIAIVGDVFPEDIKKLAHAYFDRLPAAPKPDPVDTVEPQQPGERRVIIEESTQPFLILGFHKGDILNKDEVVFDVLSDIIGRGRTSRLYKSLIKEKRLAVNANAGDGEPGEKYPNLMAFFIVPSQGHTAEECETALYAEIERLKKEPVSADELKKAKTRARADLIRALNDNMGIATQLAAYQVLTGDWRNLFQDLDRINAVTAKDVQRVAQQYLTESNRTVAVIETKQQEAAQ